MDKFTIYDFMSYFLPGVVALSILQVLTPLDYSFLQMYSDFEKGLVFSITAIVIGLFNHRLTFWLLSFKWFRSTIMPPVKTIIAKNTEGLKADFAQLIFLVKESKEEELFDKAYYYLEFKDRISSARGFQSMYFFIRNLVTLLLLIIPATLIAFFFAHTVCPTTAHSLFISTPIGIVALSWMGRWYREKFIIKVFKTYLVALTSEKTTDNEQ